jgi:hypothetical protein
MREDSEFVYPYLNSKISPDQLAASRQPAILQVPEPRESRCQQPMSSSISRLRLSGNRGYRKLGARRP